MDWVDIGGERRVLQPLWEDGERLYCKTWRNDAEGALQTLMAVLPAAEQPNSAVVSRLTHEFALKDHLDGDWAARPLELVNSRGRTLLLLDSGGVASLDSLLGEPLELAKFLRLAVAITHAVTRLHKCGLIHKDVKPANIILDPGSEHVWLTGFGIASRLPRERQAPEPPETIAGTLAYMAPEQTGRMNRSIDSRSDLYALGVTFYRMLTGELPFAASDPMEWVHCHIARKPVAPDRRLAGIPAPVSDIVMKLLAKTAEERYQTAAGVEADLRRCLSERQSHGRIEPFLLGKEDAPDRLLIPEKLYGREREVETLLASFDRVVRTGAPELVLVSGYSGIGKSAVVNELHKALVPPRAFFAAGKFDQYKRGIPYATLAQAFQSLIRPLLGKSEAELAGWRDALMEALGANGRLMIDLVPELKHIIGDQPPISELPPQDARRRFREVFQRFIGVFARPEHPLALFLDDLQWLDAATLDLIEEVLTRSDLRYLMLIGAYRDNEVDDANPLRQKLNAIKAAGAKVADVTLEPLGREHLAQLLADALRGDFERAAALAQLVHDKTGGNPFFAIQFVASLAEGNMLSFDHETALWSWDIHGIRAKRYTDNIIELMAGKLTRLPSETQEALHVLACLGHATAVPTLSIALEKTESQVHAALWPSIRDELVEREGNTYKFIHDRVQEAAYLLLPERSRAEAHLQIGRMLVANTPEERREESIFEIVNQLNFASSLITAPEEREQLAELNLLAGKRAQASSAYVSALIYLAAGAALLTEESWRQCHQLRFALELAKAHCEFASGAVTEAEERLSSLAVRAVSAAERVAVACLQVDLYQGIDRSDEAIGVGLRALRHLGVDLPEHPTEADARRAYDRIWVLLGARPIEDLINLPLATDPDSLAALDLLIRIAVPGFFRSFHLGAIAVYTAVSLGLERGHSDASCIAYAQLGIFAGPSFGQFDAGYRFGRLGCELVERPGLQRFQARTFHTFGFVAPWTQHVRSAREFLFRGFELASRIGEISYAGNARCHINTNYLWGGDPLIEAQEQAEQGLAFARKIGSATVEAWILGQLGLIRSLRGLTNRLGSFDDAVLREGDFERDLTNKSAMALPKCRYYIRKLQAYFFAGEYLDALHSASKAKPFLANIASHLESVEYCFYDALCHAAAYESASIEDRKYHFLQLKGHLEKLDGWASHCPENFGNRAALIAAELARIEGREVDAMRLYEQAVRSAREHGFPQNEGVAHEVAARFFAGCGFETSADAHLRKARDCYVRWGADGKVRMLDRLYPHLAAPDGQRSAAISDSPVQDLDVASVVKASQAVSSEIVLPKLIERLMMIALQNAGAERGLLILPSGVEFLIQAEAKAAGDQIRVTIRREPMTRMTCPETLVRYVIRTRESVILDDASSPNLFSDDEYLRDGQSKSILCLPLIKQQQLTGILLLENRLTSYAFTPARLAVLDLLAAQAAISLENTRLYNDLQERESEVRRLIDSNIIGVCIFDFDGRILQANDAFLGIVGYDRDDVVSGRMRWTALTPSEWRGSDERALAEITATGTCRSYEKEYLRKDGTRVPVLMAGANFDVQRTRGVAFALDLTDRKRAEAELAHSNRIATMGQLTASISHEVIQPIAALLTNAETAMRWLARESPDLQRVEPLLNRIVSDGKRAADILNRIRGFSRKTPVQPESLTINEIVLEALKLTRAAISDHGILATTELSDALPNISADRIQLQQVMLNLIMNAIEAMSEVGEGSRELLISTSPADTGGVVVAVGDTGPGLSRADADRVFEAFYTSKPNGLGMGLAVCRSIVEAHGGRLWATPNEPRGAVFSMMLPIT